MSDGRLCKTQSKIRPQVRLGVEPRTFLPHSVARLPLTSLEHKQTDPPAPSDVTTRASLDLYYRVVYSALTMMEQLQMID